LKKAAAVERALKKKIKVSAEVGLEKKVTDP